MNRDSGASIIPKYQNLLKQLREQETRTGHNKNAALPRGLMSTWSDAWLIHTELALQCKDCGDKYKEAWIKHLYGEQDENHPTTEPVEESDAGRDWFMKWFGQEPMGASKSLPGVWTISFRFTLTHPYISKDDTPLHILDNPVRKDKVFGYPMVAPSSWKGALRAALRATHDWPDAHPRLTALCGTSRDDDSDSHRSGRLQFYPTFFKKTGVDVINPHNRSTKVGKAPIPIECVPVGQEGRFTLLYSPFDFFEDDGSAKPASQEDWLRDLDDVAKAVKNLFLILGFGAKTSSGYGRAANKLVEPGSIRFAKDEQSFKFLAGLPGAAMGFREDDESL